MIIILNVFHWRLIPRKVAAFESGIFIYPKVNKKIHFVESIKKMGVGVGIKKKNGGRGGGFVCKVKKKSEVRSFKSNENIHEKEGGSYYVVSANKASSVTL